MTRASFEVKCEKKVFSWKSEELLQKNQARENWSKKMTAHCKLYTGKFSLVIIQFFSKTKTTEYMKKKILSDKNWIGNFARIFDTSCLLFSYVKTTLTKIVGFNFYSSFGFTHIFLYFHTFQFFFFFKLDVNVLLLGLKLKAKKGSYF